MHLNRAFAPNTQQCGKRPNKIKLLIYLALPRGQRQPNKNKRLAESGTPNHSAESFSFLPRVSHQDTTRESRSSDCASTLPLIITPAPHGAGRYQAHLDGDDRVLCISRAPLLDAARALIAAGHDADAILEMYRPGVSSWDLRAPLLVAAQLDVAETPFGPKFVRHRRPIEGCVDCNRSTARAFSGGEFMHEPVGAAIHEDDLPQA